MNVYFLLAGILALLTTVLHVVGGGREIVKPLMYSESIAENVKLTMYACWHFVTITILGSGVALSVGGFLDITADVVYSTIAAIFFIMSSMFLVITLFISKKRGFLTYPQWTLLLPIAILCALGIS